MNTPNKLSLARIILVPFMMFFYLATFLDPWGKIAAVVLFIAAALTDMLDGKIARKTGQVTNLGKLLDPIADRLLYNMGFLLIVFDRIVLPQCNGLIGLIAFAILLFRDFIIDGVRQIAASKGVVVQAFWSGKIKAILHDIHIPMFMFYAATRAFEGAFWNVFNNILLYTALVVLIAATIVTIWSICDYTLRTKDVLFSDTKQEKEKKVEKDEK